MMTKGRNSKPKSRKARTSHSERSLANETSGETLFKQLEKRLKANKRDIETALDLVQHCITTGHDDRILDVLIPFRDFYPFEITAQRDKFDRFLAYG